MHICHNCGKGFKFASKLLRHLNRITSCSPNDTNVEKTKENDKNVTLNVTLNDKNVTPNVTLNAQNVTLQKNEKLSCPKCHKIFSCRQHKYRHMKNVNCTTIDQVEENSLKEEVKVLRQENEILKATKYSVTNNVSNNFVTNYTIKYQLKYNPETRCLTTDDPNAPFTELLCFNGFKYEAARSKLKDINKDSLQQHIDNVRHNKDYYALYSFFFRNMDNRRLQMFTMGKNNNATHAQVFNNGSLEKMEKSQLFENVSKYIGQYLLNMSIDNIDIINMILSDQASKAAFIEVTKDQSKIFNYFKQNEMTLGNQQDT